MNDINWSEVDWEDIVPRLLLYAKMKLRRLSARSLSGISEEDFVSQAIEKTISGVRKWDKENTTLIDHLIGVVSSDIYNEFRKKSQFLIDVDIEFFDQFISDEKGPDDLLEEIDLKENLMQFFEEVRSYDKNLYEHLVLTAHGLSNREIATDLGIDIHKVYKYRRALKEMANNWIKENNK